MSDSDRIDQISDLLTQQPFISARELQKLFNVSPATARRDIDKVQESGLGRKVHGGVAALELAADQSRIGNLPFVENRDIAVEEKKSIAETAAKLVNDGSMIIVHGGSTCFHFGCHIADRNVRVFTNSQPLAAYLGEHGTCQLTVGGGDLHREPMIFYDPGGPSRDFYAAQFFVGALGVSQEGLLEAHPLLVRYVREMSEKAHEVIALVDSRKFRRTPPTTALPLNKVTKLVTDAGISEFEIEMLEANGVEVLVTKYAPD